MRVIQRIAVLVAITSAGCSLIDGDQLRKKVRADALTKVSSQMNQEAGSRVALRVEGNPWGQGLLVFNDQPASPADVSIWLYFPDAGWGIRTRPKRDEIYAVTAEAAKLTPGVPLLGIADEVVRGPSGLAKVSEREACDRVFRAIKHGTYLAETPVRAGAGRN